jgi:hypothetical protein
MRLKSAQLPLAEFFISLHNSFKIKCYILFMTKWLFIVALSGILTANVHAETKKEEPEKGVTPD